LLFYPDGTDVIQYSIAAGAPTGITYNGCGDMQNGAFSPSGDRFYCVEETDRLFIYLIGGGDPLQIVDLMDRPVWGVAVSPDGARAFVPVDEFLKVIDTVTFDVTEIALTCESGRDIVIVQELPPPPRNVPTLSQWGLIALAGILGIVGFMVMRRRKVTA